jgi:MFS family permease
LAAFVVIQLRSRHPLVPPRLFRNRTLVGADVGMLIAGAGLFGVFFFLTLYMQDILGYSALKTGVAYLPFTVMLVISAGVGSRILGRLGARAILVSGFVLAAGGLALLARISPTTGYLEFLPSLLIIGAGMGACFVSVTSAAVAGVPPADTGVASALLNASQGIGGSLGLAVLTAVAAARFDAVRPLQPTPESLAAADTSSWAYAFIVAAGLLFAAAVLVGWLLRPRLDSLYTGETAATDEAVDRRAEVPALLPSASTIRPAGATASPASAIRVMAQCGCHG